MPFTRCRATRSATRIYFSSLKCLYRSTHKKICPAFPLHHPGQEFLSAILNGHRIMFACWMQLLSNSSSLVIKLPGNGPDEMLDHNSVAYNNPAHPCAIPK